MITPPTTLAHAAPPLSPLVHSTVADYWPIGLLILMSASFGVITLILTHVLGPSRQGAVKGRPYESGMNPLTSARRRFNVRFYLLAMTFLIFDIEIIFLYPWATTFRQIDAEGPVGGLFLGRILFFLFTSVIAYLYAWKKGVFKFD